MLFKILIDYILGYVNVEIEGFFIERFMNMCRAKKIFIWNVKRKKSSILSANIGIDDFKKIKQVAKKTQCKIKIKEKKGIPFIFNKYKKRKIFALSIIIIFIVLASLSRFVWNIEIIGEGDFDKQELLSELNNNGMKIGTLKSRINTKDIINNIRLQRDDIAWMGININGTNAIVEVVKADEKPEIVDSEDYCNIISNKQGIISKISVKNGTAMVNVRRYSKRRNFIS